MENSPSIIVLDSNINSLNVIKSYLEEFEINNELLFYTDINSFQEKIKILNTKFIIICDENIFIENINIFKNYINKIIITTTEYSTDTIVKSMRLGIKEILPKPVLKNDLLRAINLLKFVDEETSNELSKIITIYSNKGGIGKTTVATNLAVEMAKITKEKTALIDLNLQLGDIATFLNIESKFDVGYVIKNLIEKKNDAILNAFEKYKDTELYILSDPNYIEESESITPYKVEELLSVLKKTFSYIIIDLSSNIDEISLKILDKSDMILFTNIINLPAIRNCQRCINLFKSRKYNKDKVKIIINRYMENDDIKIEDIENVINEKIYWKIPNNYFSIMEAINKGVSVSEINMNSNIANNFRDFAIKISDEFVQKTLAKYRGL